MTQKLNTDNGLQGRWTRTTGYNSTYPKGGVSCSKDSFVVNQTLVFQIKFCGKSPALRVAAKRYGQEVQSVMILKSRSFWKVTEL
jgi:hypothetical protein